MADSQKGASKPANPKEKSPPLDGGIGKEFLSSWKSLSTADDDAMDFNFEPVSKGNKKSKMNFENLGMDFNLDDDFGKLSSFKMDMPDLDFSSSPPRRSAKPKERSEEKSSSGNDHKKVDFDFSFDFNDLGGFDFGSSLKKGKMKSSEKLDGNGDDLEGSESQGSKVNMCKVFDVFDDSILVKLPASEGVVTPKDRTSAAKDSDLNSMKDDGPSKSATIRTLVESDGDHTSPEASKEADQQNHSSKEEMFTETNVHQVTEDLSAQSAGEDDTIPIFVSEVQTGTSSLLRNVNSDSGGEQYDNEEMVRKENFNHDNLQFEELPPHITPAESDNDETHKSSRDASTENMDKTETSQGDSGLEDALTTSVSRKTVQTLDNYKQQNSNSVLLIPLGSEMALDTQTDTSQKTQVHLQVKIEPVGYNKMTERKEREKEDAGVRSKYFKRLEDSIPQKDKAASFQINVSPVTSNMSDANNLVSSDEMRVDFNVDSTQTGSKLVSNSQSHHGEVKEGRSVIQGSGKKFRSPSNIGEAFDADGGQSGCKVLVNSRLHENEVTKREPNSLGNVKSAKGVISSSAQADASISNGKTAKSNEPARIHSKIVVSSTVSIRSSRIVSAEGNKLSSLKDGLKRSDISTLKFSRTNEANNDIRSATLQKEPSPLRNTVQNMELLRNTVSKTSNPVESSGKQTPRTPPLKRKSLEDFSSLKPLKRLSESLSESRNLKEHSQVVSEKLACNHLNLVDSKTKNNSSDPLSPVLKTPQEVKTMELGNPFTMEDNGNVEKAEAYAKDLENICNMLRKKREVAKELLVRAVVNNNNLLMLNHPIYEEKIRMVQKFAARLMSKQLQMLPAERSV